MPDNLSELGERFFDDWGKDISIPNFKLFQKIQSKLKEETKNNAAVQIIHQICNNAQGYKMKKYKFKYLSQFFEENKDLLLSRAGDVTQYMLIPIVDDVECFKKITDNPELYINIILSAGNQADSFKRIIESKITNSPDANLISFAKKIGIEKDNDIKIQII